jgi:hypothetical protein
MKTDTRHGLRAPEPKVDPGKTARKVMDDPTLEGKDENKVGRIQRKPPVLRKRSNI